MDKMWNRERVKKWKKENPEKVYLQKIRHNIKRKRKLLEGGLV